MARRSSRPRPGYERVRSQDREALSFPYSRSLARPSRPAVTGTSVTAHLLPGRTPAASRSELRTRPASRVRGFAADPSERRREHPGGSYHTPGSPRAGRERITAEGKATLVPVTSAAAPVITVQHVGKTFRLPHERVHTLKERALHPFRRTRLRRAARAARRLVRRSRRASSSASSAATARARSTLLKCLAGHLRAPTAATSTSTAGCRRSSSSASASTRTSPARDNVDHQRDDARAHRRARRAARFDARHRLRRAATSSSTSSSRTTRRACSCGSRSR